MALIGEVEIPIAGKMQIVDALEGLPPVALEDGADGAGRGIEPHDPVPIIRDEDPAVLVDLEAIGLAVILGRQRDQAVGRDPEDAPPGHVDDIEIAGAIEGWPFQEAVRRLAAAHGLDPARCPPGDAVSVGNPGKDLCLDRRWRRKHGPSFSAPGNPSGFRARAGTPGGAAAAVPCFLE